MTRKLDDHGTHEDVVKYTLLLRESLLCGEESDFLYGWAHGDLAEWPEFYVWLESHGSWAKEDHKKFQGEIKDAMS